jgi:acyl transferase domain-containing protein
MSVDTACSSSLVAARIACTVQAPGYSCEGVLAGVSEHAQLGAPRHGPAVL